MPPGQDLYVRVSLSAGQVSTPHFSAARTQQHERRAERLPDLCFKEGISTQSQGQLMHARRYRKVTGITVGQGTGFGERQPPLTSDRSGRRPPDRQEADRQW